MRAFASAAVALIWVTTAIPGCRAPVALTSLLPADNEASSWLRDGEPRSYEGEDLYDYIDGGAEIYHEYGFRRAVVQDYRSASGRSISLEVFEMGSPESAYGMYTFKRSGKGRGVPLGAGADLETYYLNFWRGRFLVTLTGFDEDAETLDGILSMGQAVDAKLPEGEGEPEIVKALPQPGLRPGSVKFFKGLLGFSSVSAFPSARGLDFRSGIKGDYEDGTTLILLEYGSSEALSRAWKDLRAQVEAQGWQSERTTAPPDAVAYRDPKGRSVILAPWGDRLLVALSGNETDPVALIERARR